MNDAVTTRKRIWFEWVAENVIHTDSLNPATGGQININDAMHAWLMGARMLIAGYRAQQEHSQCSPEDRELAREYEKRVTAAIGLVAPGYLNSGRTWDVGIRKGWYE